jgi:hypothetical protein
MREADPRTKKALRQLVRHPTLALKALAEDLGIAYRTIASWVEEDGPVPTLDQVRQLVQACARYDGPAARRMAEELLGIQSLGWFIGATPAVAGRPGEVAREVLEAGAAVGRVSAWAVEATSDGQVGPEEAEEGEALIRAGLRELAEAQAAVRLLEAPQLRLVGVPA